MKTTKKILLLLTIALLCAITTLPAAASARSKKITTQSVKVNVNQKCYLRVNGTKKKIKWSSSNKKIATVSSKGVVKAKKNGKCKITAKFGKYKFIWKVTVVGKKEKKIPVKEIKLTAQNAASYLSLQHFPFINAAGQQCESLNIEPKLKNNMYLIDTSADFEVQFECLEKINGFNQTWTHIFLHNSATGQYVTSSYKLLKSKITKVRGSIFVAAASDIQSFTATKPVSGGTTIKFKNGSTFLNYYNY